MGSEGAETMFLFERNLCPIGLTFIHVSLRRTSCARTLSWSPVVPFSFFFLVVQGSLINSPNQKKGALIVIWSLRYPAISPACEGLIARQTDGSSASGDLEVPAVWFRVELSVSGVVSRARWV